MKENDRASKRWQFSSESVTEGHPDKVCDQIADSILDEIISQDPLARVACEVCATTGQVIVFGEISTNAYCDMAAVARRTIAEIGYDKNSLGFNSETCGVLTSIKEQSPDIAMGVDEALETRGNHDHTLGAGDQGMMFGYACNDTDTLMPLPIDLSHTICRRMAEVRKSGEAKTFCPDGKAQVTVQYEGNRAVHIDTVVVSTQHHDWASLPEVQREVRELVLKQTLPENLVDSNTRYFINPTGRFVVGGPNGDSGLTGRKIVVDTYGGFAPHGGGSFSGKDPTKVDRSATYFARYLAKNLVAAGLADRCEIQLAYAIGVAEPVSVNVKSFGSGKISDDAMAELLKKHFDMRPQAIIDQFELRRPIYRPLAAYGHFGRRDLSLPWELTDKADLLRREAGL